MGAMIVALYLALAAGEPSAAPVSPPTDSAAALAGVEAQFCRTWAEFPDCAGYEIRRYEAYLKDYPFSGQKPHVLAEMARRYAALALSYAQADRPWSDSARAELCAAMAQSLWMELVREHAGTAEAAQAAVKLAEIPPERKAAVPIPPGVFQ